MSKRNMAALLGELFAPVAEETGFELVDAEFVKEGQNWYVRAYIDKAGGVTINDCELFSRKIEKLLDEKDPIAQTYILEVSSPGLDRALKKDADFAKYSGKTVDVKLYKAKDGAKAFQGALIGLTDGVVTIREESGCERRFAKAEIASCRLAVFF